MQKIQRLKFLTHLVRFNISEKHKDLLTFYKTIYPRLEVLKIPVVINLMSQLQHAKILDQNMWDKWESIFAKNISRFSKDELVSASQLSQEQVQISKRYFYLYEYKLQQNLKEFNTQDLVTLCVQLLTFTKVSQKCKMVLLINLSGQMNSCSAIQLLKVATMVLESDIQDVSFALNIIKQIYEAINYYDLDVKETILFFHVFHTNIIDKYKDKFLRKAQVKAELMSTIQGIMLNDPQKFQSVEFRSQDFDRMSEKTDQFFKEQTSFDHLMLAVKLLEVYKLNLYKPTSEQMELIFDQFDKNIQYLTPHEINSLVNLADDDKNINEKFRSQLLQLVTKYIKQFRQELNLQNLLILLDNQLISGGQQQLVESLFNEIQTQILINPINYQEMKVLLKLSRQFEKNNKDNFVSPIIVNVISQGQELMIQRLQTNKNQIPISDSIYILDILTLLKLDQNFTETIIVKIVDLINFQDPNDIQIFLKKLNQLMEEQIIDRKDIIQQQLMKRFSTKPKQI